MEILLSIIAIILVIAFLMMLNLILDYFFKVLFHLFKIAIVIFSFCFILFELIESSPENFRDSIEMSEPQNELEPEYPIVENFDESTN